jgi:hypothetical protein
LAKFQPTAIAFGVRALRADQVASPRTTAVRANAIALLSDSDVQLPITELTLLCQYVIIC